MLQPVLGWILASSAIHLDSSSITSPIATPYECPASPLRVSFFLARRADGSRAHCPTFLSQYFSFNGSGEDKIQLLRALCLEFKHVSYPLIEEVISRKILTVEGSTTIDARLLRNHAYAWLVMLASRNDPLPKKFGPALLCDDRINNSLLISEIEWFAGRNIIGTVCKRRCLFSS